MAVNIPWGMAADFGVQQILPKNSFVDGYFQGQENTRQNNQDARQQRISDWSLADRVNQQEAGKLAAAGDYDGARGKLLAGGQLDAGFKLDENRHELMQRAQKLNDHWGGLLSKAQTPEEWDFLIGEAKRNGAKLDHVFRPGEDWQTQQKRARVLTNYDAQQRAVAMQQAELELKQAQAATGKYTVVQPGASVIDNKTGKSILTGQGDTMESVRAKAAATEDGKLVAQQKKSAFEGMQAASSLASNMGQLRALAPNIISGAGAESKLAVIRWGESLGVRLDERTKARLTASELAKTIMTEQVLSKAQALKPLSNSDITFAQQATANIGTSATALPDVINALERAAQREVRAKQLELEYWSRNQYPDPVAIKATVDKELPEYTSSRGMVTQQPVPAPAPQQTQGTAPAPGQPTGSHVPPPGSKLVWTGSGTVLAGPDGKPLQAPQAPKPPGPVMQPTQRLGRSPWDHQYGKSPVGGDY